MEILMIVLGLMLGCLMGFMLSTMITAKRNIQDIHNAICPYADGDRRKPPKPL